MLSVMEQIRMVSIVTKHDFEYYYTPSIRHGNIMEQLYMADYGSIYY